MTENIEDRIALQDVMTRYAIAVDDKDYEGYRVLFTRMFTCSGLPLKICMAWTSFSFVEERH